MYMQLYLSSCSARTNETVRAELASDSLSFLGGSVSVENLRSAGATGEMEEA